MRSGLFLPLFDELADPRLVARLSAAAEEAGWHGLFVWDHVRWREPVAEVADPWSTLAAIATATGSAASTADQRRCAALPATRALSRSTWNTPASSPKSSPN